MSCVTCNRETHDNAWGPWCDVCGGVSFKPGQVFFRHVATVYGPGGRFPIVWDTSTSDYAYMHKDPNPPSLKRDIDGFRRPPVRVSHGSLDAMIALSYPDVAGDGESPTLVSAPSATPHERSLIGGHR
jgi:hypothetical protein